MTRRARIALRAAGITVGVMLGAAIAAPFFDVAPYGLRLKWSVERALGRRVELGAVHLSLWRGPRFTVNSVTIYEDPAIGLEPVVYVQEPGRIEVVPRIQSLLMGKFVIGAIHLDGASINLTKTGPGSEPGRWNFGSFLSTDAMRTVPAIHVRNSRVNFKFGDTKSVFYLTNTDFDMAPAGSRMWYIACSAMPARTDRSAQGLGSFILSGRWFRTSQLLDLDLELNHTSLGELTALLRGQAGMVHGSITARLHLGGPIDKIGIQGRLNIDDVHRWDLLPPHGQGWPLDIRGRLDLRQQQIELETNSASNVTPPLFVRFRASEYLSRPIWAVSVNWNRFPVGPLMELATHMGAEFPPGLKLAGTIDGAVSYSGQSGLQGGLAFHDTAVTIPDSPPVRFEEAFVVLDPGHIRLSPATVRTADEDVAQIEAAYAFQNGDFNLTIRTDEMKVASLRAQVALAAVPWFEQVKSGTWRGLLRYRHDPDLSGWTGRLDLSDARVDVPGFSAPLQLATVRAQVDGRRVMLDRMHAKIGTVEFGGEYRYEPGAVRPHRVRLRAESLDAAALEEILMPTLRRSTGLLARALGRSTAVPAWLRQWAVEGMIAIDELRIADVRIQGTRARLLWDVARVELEGIQGKLDGSTLAGKLTVNLRGERPAYELSAKLKGLSWQSGKIDVEGRFETSGIGSELLANLASEGTFTGAALDFGTLAPWRTVSGTYILTPRLQLSDVNVKTEDESYTGKGSTQDDGRLLIFLSNGAKEMRMTGTLANLKLEQ